MKGLEVLFREINDDLEEVERELAKFVDTSETLLSETSAHLLNAGGKRLRPAFALFAGKFHNYNMDNLLPLAVALELIHMASLVHDDVVDRSLTRRGMPTVKAKWGNQISVYTGSYIFAQSLVLIARCNNPHIARALAEVSVKMTDGEIQQINTANDVNQTVKDYFYRIHRKTALLISASCELGAVATGSSMRYAKALKRYGHFIGMAFQITDDVLDFNADQKILGKPVGGDLRQGIVTLPLIYALAKSEQKDRLKEIVQIKDKTAEQVSEAIEIVKNCSAIEYSLDIANQYIEKAKLQLAVLPTNKTQNTLNLIANFVRVRRF